jgi:predicted RNA binding protein YcfA (HicA-like mRNA interferase family)
MKKFKLERILRQLGYHLARQNKHDIWVNDKTFIPVPQHKEIEYFLAEKILKKAHLFV